MPTKKFVVNKQKKHENMRWHTTWHGVCDDRLMYTQTVGSNLLSMLWRPQQGNRNGLPRNVNLSVIDNPDAGNTRFNRYLIAHALLDINIGDVLIGPVPMDSVDYPDNVENRRQN